MPFVFIHGITVREDRFQRLLKTVRNGIEQAGSRRTVTGCYWGDLGRSTRYRGATIPRSLGGIRALDEAMPPTSEVALLALLLEDPLAELAMLHDSQAEFGLEAAGFEPIPQEVEQRNEALRMAAVPVAARIRWAASTFLNSDDSPIEPAVLTAVVGQVFGEAAQADRSIGEPDLRDPIARAITAGLYHAAVSDGDELTSEFRWLTALTVVQSALDEEFGGERGWFKDRAADTLTLVLRHGARNRLMRAISMFVGDVLAWFRNREAILERVDDAVRAARSDGPMVLIGHSLGGVIAFEYCVRADIDIELLATVGSQVGWFGELGALCVSDSGSSDKLEPPARIRNWRNLYDPNDALSFLAHPVFSWVNDVEIDTRAPFPVSHSEYWNLRNTYAQLVQGE